MAEIIVEHTFSHPVDKVWQHIGDTAGVAAWIPSLDSSRMEGDMRHVVFTDGQPARERIVSHDDAARIYSYQYVDGPLPLEHYLSTVVVEPAGVDTSQVRWSAEFRAGTPEAEADLGAAITEIYRSALVELAHQLA